MSDDAFDLDTDALKKRMDGAVASLRQDFGSLRTGRASATMLDAITVEAYGQETPLNQLATVNVPEPRMLSVTVWDKSMVGKVEKAIRASGLGLNPITDGATLRLPIPELNEERRREFAKLAGQYAENARVAVRNVRRDGMDRIKKADIPDDDRKMWSDEVQTMTDAHIKAIDEALDAKQHEIMQV